MADVKWIKLSTSMFDDEKIKLIEQMPDADTILMIWIKLLVQAGKVNASGNIFLSENIPYTDEMLATIFDRPISTVRLALETFKQFGMINIDENLTIRIKNWEKHQSTDKMARLKEQTRIRQQKYYYRNKLRELGINVDEKGFTDDLEELKNTLEQLEKPNVRLTLPNETEVRSKKREVRSKKREKDYSSKIKDLLSLFSQINNFNQLNKDYWDVIRETRKTGTVSESVIFNTMNKWIKYDLSVVEYALKNHIENHKGKREEYTLGIMRNTPKAEAETRLSNPVKKKGGIDINDFNLDD